MDTELNCDFYFGDKLDWAPDILSMDVNTLKGFKTLYFIRRFFLFVQLVHIDICQNFREKDLSMDTWIVWRFKLEIEMV